MNIAEKFSGARALIDSAKDHLRDLADTVSATVNDDCTTVVAEVDKDSRSTFYKLRVVANVPERASVRVFNVATELRAALDQAVYAAAILINPNRPDPKNTAFFVAETQAGFENARDGQYGLHVPYEVRTTMTGLQPYVGGRGEALANLNEVMNVKDHRRLLAFRPTITALRGSAAFHPDDGSFANSLPEYTGVASNEVEIWARVPPGFKMHADKNDFDFTIEVLLSEPERLAGIALGDFFAGVLDAVEKAVTKIESDTAAILAARQPV